MRSLLWRSCGSPDHAQPCRPTASPPRLEVRNHRLPRRNPAEKEPRRGFPCCLQPGRQLVRLFRRAPLRQLAAFDALPVATSDFRGPSARPDRRAERIPSGTLARPEQVAVSGRLLADLAHLARVRDRLIFSEVALAHCFDVSHAPSERQAISRRFPGTGPFHLPGDERPVAARRLPGCFTVPLNVKEPQHKAGLATVPSLRAQRQFGQPSPEHG